MFDRELLRGLVSIGALVGFGGLLLAFFQPSGSAEQVVSVCSAAIGLSLIALVIGVARFQQRRG